jgi:hypothetical protein
MPPVATNPSQQPPRFQNFSAEQFSLLFHFSGFFFYYCSTPCACFAQPPERWQSTSHAHILWLWPTVSKIESCWAPQVLSSLSEKEQVRLLLKSWDRWKCMSFVCLKQCTKGEAASTKNQTSGERETFFFVFFCFFVFCRDRVRLNSLASVANVCGRHT